MGGSTDVYSSDRTFAKKTSAPKPHLDHCVLHCDVIWQLCPEYSHIIASEGSFTGNTRPLPLHFTAGIERLRIEAKGLSLS